MSHNEQMITAMAQHCSSIWSNNEPHYGPGSHRSWLTTVIKYWLQLRIFQFANIWQSCNSWLLAPPAVQIELKVWLDNWESIIKILTTITVSLCLWVKVNIESTLALDSSPGRINTGSCNVRAACHNASHNCYNIECHWPLIVLINTDHCHTCHTTRVPGSSSTYYYDCNQCIPHTMHHIQYLVSRGVSLTCAIFYLF